MKIIGFKKIQSFENILALGVAGGSVIRILADEIKFKGKITGVDIDEAAIKIARTYFNLDKFTNLEIIIEDAYEFVFKTTDKFDFIIIDIFQDSEMPGFLFETLFINRICFLLKPKG